MNKFDYKNLTPFKWFILENFPFIEDDFDALTNWQLFCKLGAYMNMVINSQNTVGEQVENLTDAFIGLQNYVNDYFDNLDVQDEINNKLDDMVEDGSLTSIISAFINSTAIWCYDTVSAMQSANNLINGSYARTLGYYSKYDGGGALYKIENTSTAYSISCQNNLKANLIAENNQICVNQFGAKGDGQTDDQDAINLAYTYANTRNIGLITFKRGATYMVRGYEEGQPEGGAQGAWLTTGIVVKSNTITDLNNCLIKVIANSRKNYNIFSVNDVSNVTIKNGKLMGDISSGHTDTGGEFGFGVAVRCSHNTILKNLHCSKFWGDGIIYHRGAEQSNVSNNALIEDCICDDNRRQGLSITCVTEIKVINSKFTNSGKTLRTNPASGVDIEPYSTETVENVYFENCDFNDNYNDGLTIMNETKNVIVKDCRFINNPGTTSQSDVGILGGYNIIFENCQFGDEEHNFKVFYMIPTSHTRIINCVFFDGRCTVSSNKMTDGLVEFINNTFYRKSTTTDYNAVIEGYTSDSTTLNDNNIVVITGNKFYNKSGNRKTNITYVRFPYSAKFKKLICTDNLFKDSKRAIHCNGSMIVKDNNFVTTYEHPIYIGTRPDGDTPTRVISNNIFEQCSYATQSAIAGLMLITDNNNCNLCDNVLYRKPLNINDLIVGTEDNPINEPTRFSTATAFTGGSQNERNVILEN